MSDVYQTLDGTFFITIGSAQLLEISKSKIPEIPCYQRDGVKREDAYEYTFVDNKLMYGEGESVYIGIAETITELLDGSYVWSVEVVDNDFLAGWKK